MMHSEPDDPVAAAAAAIKAEALAELGRNPYRVSWWLRGGRRQTLLSAVHPSVPAPEMSLERIQTPDDDFLRVHHSAGAPDQPVIVTLHGLEGSARSKYVQSLASMASGRGWQFVAMEYRSCGGEMNRAPRTYHMGDTGDLDLVVQTLRRRHPGRRIYLTGISMGGNIVLRWLGERHGRVPVEVAGAAAVSPPFDVPRAAEHVDRALGGAMARVFLKTMIPKAIEKAQQYPGLIDVDAASRSRSFREFDSAVTAPLHGFRDAEHYWESTSCGPLLDSIRRPTLLISSRDDPLVPAESIPEQAIDNSPFLVPQWTDRGGHAAFVTGAAPWRSRRWAEQQVVRFFDIVDARCSD